MYRVAQCSAASEKSLQSLNKFAYGSNDNVVKVSFQFLESTGLYFSTENLLALFFVQGQVKELFDPGLGFSIEIET